MGAFLLGVLGVGKTVFGLVGKALGALATWAVKDIRNAIMLALAAALGWTVWTAHELGTSRDHWQAISGKFEHAATTALDAAWKWKAARDTLAADVVAKQKAAAEADAANVARVKAEGAQINERTAHDYQARLDDTGAALERLRDQLAAAAAATVGDQGDGGTAAVPAAYTARCRAFGAADCDALLAALPGKLAAAEDNTSQLIGLQDYVRSTLAIDYSGAAAKPAEQDAPK